MSSKPKVYIYNDVDDLIVKLRAPLFVYTLAMGKLNSHNTAIRNAGVTAATNARKQIDDIIYPSGFAL